MSLDELTSAFEFAAVGAAAQNAGFDLPSRDRLEEIRAAGVTTREAADAFGKRLPELRCGRQSVNASESPNQGFADFIQAVSEPERPDLTIEKLAGVFDVLKPHLVDVYERTLRETDQICDAPTIELLELGQSTRTGEHDLGHANASRAARSSDIACSSPAFSATLIPLS